MEKIMTTISSGLDRMDIEYYLNVIPRGVLVFFILSCSFLSFELNGNEEQYMLFAKQYMNPDWINSRYLNEFPGTRLFYQIIVGYFLNYFSFETVVFISRLVLCIAFAHGLSRIYSALNFKNWQILLHLPLLFLFHQSLFAGSWMLISVEPKGLAYVFVVHALYYYMKGNYKPMIIFIIIASYFHILVGCYAFIFFILGLFRFQNLKDNYQLMKICIVYIIFIIPFMWYLKEAVISKVNYEPSVDWIYTYFRSPQHTAIFKDLSYFYSHHFYGVFLAVIALVFSIRYIKIDKNEQINRLNYFVFYSLLGVLLFVFVALVDREGVLLKYYPFRINTLTTFVLTLLISSFIVRSIREKYKKMWVSIIILLAFCSMLQLTVPTIQKLNRFIVADYDNDLLTTASFIKEMTKKDAVVLSFVENLSLTRKFERDQFVVYKFIPAMMNDIPEWYERVLFKRKLAKNIDLMSDKILDYKIDYVFLKQKLNSPNFKLVYSNSSYNLYEVIPTR